MLMAAVFAPIVGSLGTLVGMMRAYDKLSEAEVVDPPELAGAISQSLLWTAVGVAVGIVFLVGFIALGRRTLTQPDSFGDE